MYCSETAPYHVCQGDVKKHAPCKGKDDIGGKAAANQDANDQADVAGHGRQQVEEDGLSDAHSRIQQDHKVACRGRQKTSPGFTFYL